MKPFEDVKKNSQAGWIASNVQYLVFSLAYAHNVFHRKKPYKNPTNKPIPK